MPDINALIANQQIGNTGAAAAANRTLDLQATWNAGGTTFQGLFYNVTDTASAAASLLLDVRVGGVSKHSIRKDGRVIGADANSYYDLSGGFFTFASFGSTTFSVGSNVTANNSYIAGKFYAQSAVAPTIASAGTIAPTVGITFISGVAAIGTITAPAPLTSGGGTITLIPTGLFTWTAAGNIAIAGVAVVGKALTMTWDNTSAKWYPSYVA